MYTDDLTLVLYGRTCYDLKKDTNLFWSRFIELQKKIPTGQKIRQIVVHTWSFEHKNLIDAVYGPCLSLIQEKATDNQNPIRRALDDEHSRYLAIDLLEKNQRGNPNFQLLVLKLSSEGNTCTQINSFVFDRSLPKELIYLPYHHDVDEKYLNDWIVGPWAFVRQLKRFYGDMREYLDNPDGFLSNYENIILIRNSRWPFGKKLRGFLRSFLLFKLRPKVLGFQDKFLDSAVLSRLVYKVCGCVISFIDKPLHTKENSSQSVHLGRLNESRKPGNDFSERLFRLFVYSNELRTSIRFLNVHDFYAGTESGSVISPEPVVLIFQNDTDQNHSQLEKLFKNSRLPVKSAYFLSANKIVRARKLQNNRIHLSSVSISQATKPRHLSEVFNEIQKFGEETSPTIVLGLISLYLNCRDWQYLNALVKYAKWNRATTVSFGHSNKGWRVGGFPELRSVSWKGFFSGWTGIVAVDHFVNFLGENNETGNENITLSQPNSDELHLSTSKLLFPYVL